ncbi:MAG: 4Fe-4S binding protein [Desulfobulbaceae bacterium]|nr:4Fe-4S binding protein [Desulfobulbaceae bacterium]
MLQFSVDSAACIQCGACSEDCPTKIISMGDKGPVIPADKEELCYRCQHCLAVCPTGALSILGLNPANSVPLASKLPVPEQMEALIKGRRSVRQYAEDDLSPELINRLLATAWHAPTGVNARQVRFTVIDTRAKLQQFRETVLNGLEELGANKTLPAHMERFLPFVQAWQKEKKDIIFRDAPHLVLASAPKGAPTPMQDCLIALSYFELYAQACQVGTVWAGLAYLAIETLLSRLQPVLALPENHQIGYAMLFGKAAVRYERGVQHENAPIHYVK